MNAENLLNSNGGDLCGKDFVGEIFAGEDFFRGIFSGYPTLFSQCIIMCIKKLR